MRDSPDSVDTAVVGGGLAGLTAAVLLAQSGQRVRLFERSHALGGRAATTAERGFYLNYGPHAWYVGGPGTRVLTDLGVPLKGASPRPAGGFALYRNRLHTLPIGFISLLTTNLLSVHGKLAFARVLTSIRRIDTAAFDDVTVADWLRRHINDERARAVVEMLLRVATYAAAPEIVSAGAALNALQSVVRHNVRYLDGGWQSIVDALAARARSLGVTLDCSTSVAEVLHAGEVEGLRLGTGQRVSARSVILAVGPPVVRELAPRAAQTMGDGLPVPAGAACLDVALNRLSRPDHIIAFGVDQPLYCVVHSATAKLAPPGGATIHATKYLNPMEQADPTRDERELESLMDMLQPGWKREIVVRRFLPSMVVAHAIPLARHSGLRGRAPVAIQSIPGLYLAGDWVGMEGTLGNAAVASAALAAQFAVERCQRVAAA